MFSALEGFRRARFFLRFFKKAPCVFALRRGMRIFARLMERIEVNIREEDLRRAGAEGADVFLALVAGAVKQAAGGELTAEVLPRLKAEQITLWGWTLLHEEVMDGGFIQLIHNGYGPFFFDNPFARVMKMWGLRELAKDLYAVRRLYLQYGEELTRDMSDEDFMALYEAHPEFDEYDDNFVVNEEDYVAAVAEYVDEHLGLFAKVISE